MASQLKSLTNMHQNKMTNLLIRASYRELAGPEELAVRFLPLTESLDCPRKGVLHILAYFCPDNMMLRLLESIA